MSDTEAPASGWVLYDGDCGVCSRWVSRFRTTLKRLGLGIAPLQSSWVSGDTGLPAEVLMQDIRLLHEDGRITSGADVYRYVMRRVWWAYPIFLLSVTPGLRGLFNWCYRTFARHRSQISSKCGLSPQVRS